ncbi:retrovirus-related pol polyprotein from transposon TNT 1-94, partial [Tanacetum coccineum]
ETLCCKKSRRKEEHATYKSSTKEFHVYLPENIDGWKPKDLKNKSFANIQDLFDKAMKRVNTFVDMETDSKRTGGELEYDKSKKQKVEAKIDDAKEAKDLKQCLEIVLDDGDDVTINATPLSVKIPIMLKNFDREDLEVLWRIVKARFKKIEPVNYMDTFLHLNLKTMFEHHVEDMQSIPYYLLVKKMYPLTKHILHQMFNDVKLQVDYECEMAYELLRLVKKQLKEGYPLDAVWKLLLLVEVKTAKVIVTAAKQNLVLFCVDHHRFLEGSERLFSAWATRFNDNEMVQQVITTGKKVLRQVTGETTAAGVWTKIETLYMRKSLANKLCLNKMLYTFYMPARRKIFKHIDEFYKIVLDLVNIKEIKERSKAKGDDGEGLYMRGRTDHKDSHQSRGKSRSKSRVEDSIVTVGDNRECRSRNLILLGTLEKEGFAIKLQSGKVKVINGFRVVLSKIRRDNCVYYLDCHAMAGELNASVEEKDSLAQVWHKRLGHISKAGLQVLEKQGLFGKKSLGGYGFISLGSNTKYLESSKSGSSFRVENQTGTDRQLLVKIVLSGKLPMKEEIDSLRKNKTWDLVDHPARQKLVELQMAASRKGGLKVFKSLVTRKVGGSVDSHRGRPTGYEQDDMLIACKSKAKIRFAKSLLKKEFDIKELREAKKILGMEIVWDRIRKILRVS